jgi:hypothetical protein
LVAAQIAIKNSDVSSLEWNVFNRGVAFSKEKPVPFPQGLKLTEKQWQDLCSLKSAHVCYETLAFDISKNVNFKKINGKKFI